MKTFETVIVPLDGSPHDDVAIPAALDEAMRHDARLVMLFVVERPQIVMTRVDIGGPLPHPAPGDDESVQVETEEATDYLNTLRHRYHLFANVDMVVLSGDPVLQIESEAARTRDPLVVMSIEPLAQAFPHTRFDRASRLIRHGQLQLLLVNSKRQRNHRGHHQPVQDRHAFGLVLH
ncbi:MAG: universal stress protein [Thermomicrobiales bacterium]